MSFELVCKHLKKLTPKELNKLKLILSSVVVPKGTLCDKCKNTGVIWSKDRMNARTCGCK